MVATKTTREIIIENAIAIARHKMEYSNGDKLWVSLDELREKVLPVIKLYLTEHLPCDCDNCKKAKEFERFFAQEDKVKKDEVI